MQTIQFVATSPQDLKNEITADLKVILEKFLENYKPAKAVEYLTRQQVAKMFDVDLSTVHNWSKSGKLKPLALGSRIYFLRSDIEACLIPLNQ